MCITLLAACTMDVCYKLGECVKREHCTALRVVQHPSMTPTGWGSVWMGCIKEWELHGFKAVL